ncbi:MAG: ATP-dependent RNA helicase HrpA [Phycisphaerales bacterium]|nr:ATP-dependent RNA helicase HrpA [Phycisphaerales bacterium]
MDSRLATIKTHLRALDGVMLADRRRLRRELRKLRDAVSRGETPPDVDDRLTKLSERIDASSDRRAQRVDSLPKPDFDLDLPVLEAREEIEACVRDHQVTVICGETGSGKTTQLPKICLNLGRGAGGLIGHTQPRRIAARSVSARIADELGVELGGLVGYQVRFDERYGEDTAVKVMTDGVLLAETQRDRWLDKYDTIIVDEAHERSLNIDFLLGYLKRIMPRRPDLRIIITSATIDPERFSQHFDDAPILEVSGRTYPVDLRYDPPEADLTDTRELVRATVAAVNNVCHEGPGDVLVFLPGEREIREVAKSLEKGKDKLRSVLPLYSRLSAEEQNRVFRPGGGRRIVLATNVAETSITVPGIRYVVDPGLARLNRYSPRTRVQRLPIENISRASADQRAGRCGRVGPGICVRLYDENAFESRPRFTDPEILRSNLAGVILQMKSLKLGDIDEFPLIERPDRRAVQDGLQTLRELGAIDEEHNLTKIGRELSKLPIDPRIGRILIAGAREGCLNEMLVIASALSVQDPRERPFDKRDQADELHAEYDHPESDFLAYWNLWDIAHGGRRNITTGRLGNLCRSRMLSFTRMREWIDTQKQLRGLMTELGYHINREPATYSEIHKAILAGFLGGIGKRGDKREFQGIGQGFVIHPSSAIIEGAKRKDAPTLDWIVSAELVRTTKLFARMCARVRPSWIEEVAGNLCKRTYENPHFRPGSGKVYAFERVTLFGLEVIAKRRVDYGRVNPAEARELFIHHGLVDGQLKTEAPAIEANKQLQAELRTLEDKARRRDLVADVQRRFDFYAKRLPEDVWTAERFETWRRQSEKDDPSALAMTSGDLLLADASAITQESYPDRADIAGTRLPLAYRFEPGEADDGVTANVPIEALGRLRSGDLDWMVPGLLAERAQAMLRALPKTIRRNIDAKKVAHDFAQSHASTKDETDPPTLPEALAEHIGKITGVDADVRDLASAAVPEHTRPNVRVIDGKGQALAESRDLMGLKARFAGRIRDALLKADTRWPDRRGISSWDFGPLPEHLEIKRPGVHVIAYPALVDMGDSVRTAMLERPEAAEAVNRRGVRRLIMLHARRALRAQVERLPAMDGLLATYAVLGASKELRDDLLTLVAEMAFLDDRPLPRTSEAMEAAVEDGIGNLGAAADRAVKLADELLARAVRLRARTEADIPPPQRPAFADVASHVAQLTPGGFLSRTPPVWLARMVRYLDADRLRLDKLRGSGIDRDQRAMQQIAHHEARRQRVLGLGIDAAQEAMDRCPALAEYRWMCEELRVATYAQELGVAVPVSDARMESLWHRVLEDAAGVAPELAGVA